MENLYFLLGPSMTGSRDFKAAALHCPNCGAAATHDRSSCVYCGSSIATRICPACFGSLAVGMKHCPFCGAVVPESAPGRESSLQCPYCESALERIVVGKHTVHECVQCGGLWIDRNSFQDICTREEEQEAVLRFRFEEKSESGKPQFKRKRAYIPCPECGKLMNHKNFSHCSGVILDWCRDHGSWFDKRELQEIVMFIRNGGLKKARERELRNLRDEKARLRAQKFDLAVRSNSRTGLSGGVAGFGNTGDSILEFLQEAFFD
ncbi:MAG: zf-TFIIB domain-containing protein [Acidobacteria bacterium]|nr:zf-TFIIB domain-containing protein [Acidobacteriota bacterium]